MKTVKSIFANLLLLAIISACTKKEKKHSDNQRTNYNPQKQSLHLNKLKHIQSNDFLIDEQPFYEL